MIRTFLALLSLTVSASAQQLCGEPVDEKWLITPERTSWTRTSTSDEVHAFLTALQTAHPQAFRLSAIGRTLQGREIMLATVLRRPKKKPKEGSAKRLRALILANIHGGEVEGKEAVQVLLREIALGAHADILKHCDLWFVPIYNVDGNDEIHPSNRASQNGPSAGVGKRTNSQGFDLNRDVVKAEAPETRALLGLIRRVDPHLFMDLHTTNGSPHGYHLTYSPSLATNLDPDVDDLMHERFIPTVRKAMVENHGFRIFDYGNFPRRGRGDPRSWTTYDHKPRLVFNYVGLRNRLSLLSEAYSYLPFKERALVTRAFVLESLRELLRRKDEVLATCAEADRRVLREPMRFGFDSALREGIRGKVLVGEVEREGRRRVAGPNYREVEMDVRVRFEARKSVPYPAAWALVGVSDEVRKTLLHHGVKVHRLRQPVAVAAQQFRITSMRKPRMNYQGHRLVTLRGELVDIGTKLPRDALIVLARQPAARIAAQLLEGVSEDSLATWNFFDDSLARKTVDDEPTYPVLRIEKLPQWQLEQLFLARADYPVSDAPYRPAPRKVPANAVTVTMLCAKPGRRIVRGAFETNARWEGREVALAVDGVDCTDEQAMAAAVKKALAARASSTPCVLRPGPAITNAELTRAAELLNGAGAKTVWLHRVPE